jgi:hypothetical protein
MICCWLFGCPEAEESDAEEVTPEEMEQYRELVRQQPHLQASVDALMGAKDTLDAINDVVEDVGDILDILSEE